MYDDITPDLDVYDFGDDDENYDVYQDDPEDDDGSLQTSIDYVFRYCVRPTILEAYVDLLHVFLVCLVYRAATQFLRIPNPFHHLASAAAGAYVLYVVVGINGVYTVALALFGTALIHTSHFINDKYRNVIVSIVVLSYLLLSELGLTKQSTWERIRGPQMVMCMKIISYAFDTQNGSTKTSTRTFNAFDFIGYLLCPGTLMFGPWTPFSDYMAAYENECWDLRWAKKVVTSLVKSLFFFSMSMCLLEWAIPETSGPTWLMYRDAMLFRGSHYFVSFVSETTAALAGYQKAEVTQPWAIEFPNSLVQVVVYWNLPIHRWLKTYVFRTTLPAGTFVAVMCTYFVSALLHGANIKLSAILLSLGLYTYAEYSLRKKLSVKLSACVGARPCQQPCSLHKFQPTNNILVHSANLIFTFLAMFHLAYLGCIIDTSGGSSQHPFQRWSEASYISHTVAAAAYGVNALLTIV